MRRRRFIFVPHRPAPARGSVGSRLGQSTRTARSPQRALVRAPRLPGCRSCTSVPSSKPLTGIVWQAEGRRMKFSAFVDSKGKTAVPIHALWFSSSLALPFTKTEKPPPLCQGGGLFCWRLLERSGTARGEAVPARIHRIISTKRGEFENRAGAEGGYPTSPTSGQDRVSGPTRTSCRRRCRSTGCRCRRSAGRGWRTTRPSGGRIPWWR